MIVDIKPCPFCGGNAEYWIDNDYQDRHVISCSWCGCEKRYEYSMEGVVEEWNIRHIPEGYVLVPVEPTDKMIANVKKEWEGSRHIAHRIIQVYRAMIAAAQD